MRTRLLIFSVPSARPMASANSGVVELSTPETPESTVWPPIAKSVKGMALPNVATKTMCPQIRRSRGSDILAMASTTNSTAAPRNVRTSKMCAGARLPSASFIHRKLDPHSRASTPILISFLFGSRVDHRPRTRKPM